MLLKVIAQVIALVKGYTVKIAQLETELLKAKESGIATEGELKTQRGRADEAEAKVAALEESEVAEDATELEALAALSALLPQAPAAE